MPKPHKVSGLAPDTAMNRPEVWRVMRFGNGRQMIESLPPHPALTPG